jgi:hypothetical protein
MRKTSQTIFTGIAYGFRGFQYGGGLYDGNKRDKRGVPTPNHLGKAALKINQAVKAFSPVFETARTVDVYHTKPLPPFCKEAPQDHWARPNGKNICLGEFADPQKNRFLVLANRDHASDTEATLTLGDAGLKLEKMNKQTAKWEPIALKKADGAVTAAVKIEAGAGELLRAVDADKKAE